MDRPLTEPAGPKDAGVRGSAAPPKSRRSSFASRLFGYDIFLSFALGPPPRGTHSYASDLARRNVRSSCAPGGASSSQKNTLKSRSRKRRATSEA